ncbi:sugar ABC transporter ATP-binding protein [Paeniglutamicibacter sp. ABSL32-1]|uniref:sugar ABC transporter ATP-binding protein n=1 Tax=Paeniglutamicibacter quisquiliarum TaxID=2849498 RepID=UPI001C2CCAEE|nr:sugar ABC transporter ATP-binding protein [Paeniglutamicibacter quisquiliarum]MBV1781049.1 sugar ABC transporter ATP-binding protein [Paeniglutamicibacter quisquiliarum]
MNTDDSLLQITNLTKVFKGFKALDSVSFDLKLGEVVGLAGHNGAGKSTLLNILSGNFAPTSGSMTLDGTPFQPSSYNDSTRAGVFRIYQELSVMDNLTVAENLTLGTERHIRKFGLITPNRINNIAGGFLDDVGLGDLDATKRVDQLTMAEKQLVEIAKAMYMARLAKIEKPVLLLDEPTSGLTQSQVDFLEEHINNLRSSMGIILTTHRGSELLEWSDRVVVLRDGQVVGTPDPKTTTPEQLSRLLLGDTEVVRHTRRDKRIDGDRDRLELRRLTLPSIAEPFSMTLRPGEIVALIGESEEKTAVARCVSGLVKAKDGTINVDGEPVSAGVRGSLEAGIRFVPADRAGEGLSLLHSVQDNLSLGAMAAEGRQDLARKPHAAKAFAQDLVTKFGVKVSSLNQSAGSLSGGNQQKLLVARALSEDARVVVLDKPTRGIDVHAKAEIFRLVLEASDRGVAILIASDEPEELMPICDRIIAFRDGVVSAEFDCRSESEPTLGELAESIS